MENDTDAIVVMIGTGIACGIFSGGKIITGSSGFAGELGSVKMTDKNGNIRTLDELAGGAAILAQAGIPIEQLLEKLDKNDEQMLQIISQSSFYMGLALANLINVLNPSRVILGGSTATYKGYFENLFNTIKACTLPELMENLSIEITRHPKNLVALGAILNALKV